MSYIDFIVSQWDAGLRGRWLLPRRAGGIVLRRRQAELELHVLSWCRRSRLGGWGRL